MSLDDSGYSFLFEVLAEKHNAVIRKIREIPPWEWGGEFLELEPQVRKKSMTVRTVGRESRWDGERRTLNAASSW